MAAFEEKLKAMPYGRLVQYMEEAVGYKLGLPETLDGLTALELWFLILKLKSVDLICSSWHPWQVDAVKWTLIALIRREMEKKQEEEAFAEAVRGLGRCAFL